MLVDCDTNDYGCDGGMYTNAWAFLKTKGGAMKSSAYSYVSGTTQVVRESFQNNFLWYLDILSRPFSPRRSVPSFCLSFLSREMPFFPAFLSLLFVRFLSVGMKITQIFTYNRRELLANMIVPRLELRFHLTPGLDNQELKLTPQLSWPNCPHLELDLCPLLSRSSTPFSVTRTIRMNWKLTNRKRFQIKFLLFVFLSVFKVAESTAIRLASSPIPPTLTTPSSL